LRASIAADTWAVVSSAIGSLGVHQLQQKLDALLETGRLDQAAPVLGLHPPQRLAQAQPRGVAVLAFGDLAPLSRSSAASAARRVLCPVEP
jgi:hypothetical protein